MVSCVWNEAPTVHIFPNGMIFENRLMTAFEVPKFGNVRRIGILRPK